ncbi:energy transducer TonB family protein [Mesorhizobium sp. A556]
MGLEPSFSRSTLAWPLAGPDALPLEPSDPTLAIPRGALQISLRDMTEDNTSIDIGAEPLPAPKEKLGGVPARSVNHAKRWPIAVVASCVLHAAVAMVLLTTPQWWPSQDDPTQIEGADQTGMMVAGNADADQAMAGDVTQVTLVPMVNAKPVEIVEAKAVVTDEAAQPVEQAAEQAPATEVLEPVTDLAPAPSEIERVQPETPDPAAATTPAPEILAAASPQPDSDNVVQQAVQAESVEPVQEAPPPQVTQPVTEEEIKTPEIVEAIPEPRPVRREKPAETPKPVEKQAKKAPAKPKPSKPKAGSGGANQADSKRGVASGQIDGETAIASKGGARSSSAGNAAVSNYPGKVAAKLRRASRSLSRTDKAKASNNAQVSFVVSAQGGVGAVRLVRSSGSPGLDETALAIIRRAAPFPPIPAEAGRSSWAFTLPIGPF